MPVLIIVLCLVVLKACVPLFVFNYVAALRGSLFFCRYSLLFSVVAFVIIVINDYYYYYYYYYYYLLSSAAISITSLFRHQDQFPLCHTTPLSKASSRFCHAENSSGNIFVVVDGGNLSILHFVVVHVAAVGAVHEDLWFVPWMHQRIPYMNCTNRVGYQQRPTL